MTTLFDIAGIQARIFHLPQRPPFMIAPDLAEVYGKRVKDLAEAVSRNPERFPEEFCFRLTEMEEEQMWPHFAATSRKKRSDVRPLVFTHGGAYALSAVLKSPTAAQVSVIVHRAFAAMEAKALADAQFMLTKLRTEEAVSKRIRAVAIEGVRSGLTFERIWRMGNYSRPRLAQALRECLALGLIECLPEGMPHEQPSLFGRE